jgi:hypothetical protein
VQIAERDKTGLSLSRARSIAAHWRQAPQFGSGVLALGVKPEIVLLWTWSRKRRVCLLV